MRIALISGCPMGVYEVPTGAIGAATLARSLWTEYLEPEASLTRFIISEVSKSD